MLYWRRKAKISRNDCVKTEDVLHRDQEWNCFIRHVTKGKIIGKYRNDRKMRKKRYAASG
jgi:hypothetical protein